MRDYEMTKKISEMARAGLQTDFQLTEIFKASVKKKIDIFNMEIGDYVYDLSLIMISVFIVEFVFFFIYIFLSITFCFIR